MTKIRETSYLGTLKKVLLYRFEDIERKGDLVMLAGITEEEEEVIDNNSYYITHNNVRVPDGKIYFYGTIDTSNEEDRAIIISKHLVDDRLRSSQIPADFNYETGWGSTCNWVPTADAVRWFEYCHARIGKPKRVIAYRIPRGLS